MKKKKWWQYRQVGTSYERRYACKHSDHHPYIRAKRKANLIADSWWDQRGCYQKGWKVRREKQYHTDGRGTERTITVDSHLHEWSLHEYFEDHNNSHKIEKIEKRKPRQILSIFLGSINPLLRRRLSGTPPLHRPRKFAAW